MPVIVVGGSGRNVGKTSLICGLISALPEFQWTAVKITSHEHGMPEPIWEEREAGQGTGAARYLAARAQRAFLMTALEADLPGLVRELQAKAGADANFIFESNRIVEWMRPDVCLSVTDAQSDAAKPSFAGFVHRTDARVERSDRDEMVAGEKPLFRLADLTRVSDQMQQWVRDRLAKS